MDEFKLIKECENQSLIVSGLTVDILKEMEPGTVFARGKGLYPGLYSEPIRWVASRGLMHDWALYYHRADKPWSQILTEGDKSTTESIIRKLVPCDDETWKMYRLY